MRNTFFTNIKNEEHKKYSAFRGRNRHWVVEVPTITGTSILNYVTINWRKEKMKNKKLMFVTNPKPGKQCWWTEEEFNKIEKHSIKYLLQPLRMKHLLSIGILPHICYPANKQRSIWILWTDHDKVTNEHLREMKTWSTSW